MTSTSARARDLAVVATFAGFIAALGLVPAFAPFGFPVPITLQSFGIMLTGAVLGARRGASAVLLFLALVALGLPLLSGGPAAARDRPGAPPWRRRPPPPP